MSQFEKLKNSDYLTFKFDVSVVANQTDLPPLSKNELEYAQTLQSSERLQLFLLSHSLLHSILEKEFKIKSANLLRLETGQWILKDTPLHFSISHSESKIFLGISAYPIGVDVQRTVQNLPPQIAKKLFHMNEISFLEKQPENHFTSLFSLKEAYGKALGTGLTNVKEIDLSKYLKPKFKFLSFYEESCEVCLEKSGEYVYSVCVLRK